MGRRPLAVSQRWKWLLLAGIPLLIGACTGRVEQSTSVSDVDTQSTASTVDKTTTPESTAQLSPSPTVPSTPTPSPTRCAEPSGKTIEETYPGSVLQNEIPIVVYLPPCYQNSSISYPVLYLLHGYPYDQSHWIDLGVINIADEVIRAGVGPFILVMPLQPEPLFRKTDGGPGSYETEFLEGLLPYIDSHYRTIKSPSGRYLAGISRGAIWALEIGLRNPGFIGKVAAFSPSLSVNYARPEYDPFVIASQAGRIPSEILFVAGEDDWALPKTTALHEVLSDRGASVNSRLEIVPGEHVNATWTSALELLFGLFENNGRE